MVAFGHSAGARHARAFGYVKNLLRKRNDKTFVNGVDQRVLGVMGLSWAIILTLVPTGITDRFTNALEKSGMPPIFSETTTQGGTCLLYTLLSQFLICLIDSGYELKIGDEVYEFPLADRSPPEAYLAAGYSSYVLVL